MEIILILLMLLLSIFFLIVGLSKNSPLFAVAGGIGLIIISIILVTDGVTIMDGRTASHTLNVTTSGSKISGNIDTVAHSIYTTYKDQYVLGFGIILALIGMRVTQKVLYESNQGA
jgi:hypothetical protein